MFYFYISILIFQIIIIFSLFYVLFFKRKIERFSNVKNDSEIMYYIDNYHNRYGPKNDEYIRADENSNTTFLNFHFHAADAGFLRIGEFLLEWGLGGNHTGHRREGKFVKGFFPNNASGVFANPVGTGGGEHTLRLKFRGPEHFAVDDAGACEHPYFFLAYGFKPISNEERGNIKITYNKNQEHEFPKRMKYLADTKGDFKYNYRVNENNDEYIPGGC